VDREAEPLKLRSQSEAELLKMRFQSEAEPLKLRSQSEAEPLKLRSQVEPGNEVDREVELLKLRSQSEAEPLKLRSQVEPGNELELESLTEHYNRGLALKKQGKFEQAIACYQKAIQIQSNYAPAYNSLGIVYREKGQLKRAIQCYQKAIECQPDYFPAYNNLGNALRDEGKLDEAIASYQQALKFNADYINALFNLGNALQQQRNFPEAIKCLQQVIQRQPNYVDAYSSLAHAYKAQENLVAAINCYQKAIELQPDSASAHCHLGIALQAQGNLPAAAQSYQRALEFDANNWLALINLGDVWRNQGYPSLAIHYYRKALGINPDNETGKINLASALKDRGAIEEAIAMSRQIVTDNPSLVHAHQNLLLYLHYSQDCEPSAIYEEHKNWAKRHASLLGENIDYSGSDRHPDRRLRIGYVSGDFLTHSVSFFFEPLLTAHNQRDFEVICYANNNKSDDTTARLRKLAAGWREIYNLNDEQFAQLVIQDKIDILVDLSGHTNGNRLLAFARKLAPIQVSYIGYPNTTGIDAIDYRITDNWTEPEGQTEHLHSEQLIRLPHGFLCYQPPQNYPEVSSSPVLEKGHITFGCFNNLSKVNPQLISYWANILKNVPESRMLIKSWTLADSGMRDSLHQLFQQQGIEPNRIELSGWIAAKNEHLSLYNQVDIALDTFPYNGTTTTCEAMWMGVPVITLAGQTHVSRVGVSLLSSVGLEELIAQSAEEYVQKAVNLANNRERLPQMRANLRAQMQAAPLTNAGLISQSLEAAYRQMWRCWCDGEDDAGRRGQGDAEMMTEPDSAQIEAKLDLGIEYHKSGQLEAAAACYQQVLQWQRNRADAWHLLGLIAYQQQQYETAIAQINRAIALNPDAPSFHNNLGSVYQKQQKLTEAIASHQKAIQLQPKYVEAHYNLAVAYQGQNKLASAIECYQKVVQIQPNYAQAYYNLGKVYEEQKEPQQALNCYQKAIQHQADYVEAYFCLANILMNQGYCTLAIDYFRQVLELDPDRASAHNNLASTFKDQGKITEAIAHFRQAIAADPAFAIAQSNLLFNLHYSDEYTPAAIYTEHQHWCDRNATPLAAEIPPHSNNPNPDRRLRIGYVSADFFTHSVSFFFEPLLAASDRQNFHITCYANNKQIDPTTQRLRQLADDWREIYPLNDAQLADLIRQDAIDILVDLSGHTKGNRLLTFARQPAPVQVSYIGYPNTTGLNTINYRIVDGWTDPEGQTEHLHTEQLIRLPHGFLCYKPPVDCPEVSSSPPICRTLKGAAAQTNTASAIYIGGDRITFGSFNKLAKISPKLINYWAQILKSVPNSRLLLKSRSFIDSGTCNYLHALFQQQGIDPQRVELIGWISSKSEHLALYNQIDIALDTFPYNGTTTTCEAMWMGVPVITLAGETHVSRVGVSLLSSVGLNEYIAQSPQEYIQKAVDLANNREKLPQLRANLRGRMLASPLMDAGAIARSLEDAYRTMWRHWCSNNNASYHVRLNTHS
jgi:predicted O-linked N-acetylglucosamine transferase (SPINDLY family)